MADAHDNLSPAESLMAYADGELDAARQLQAARRVAQDPAAARAVEQQVQLRQAVQRAVCHTPGPSPELTKAVAAMAFQMPSAAGATPRPRSVFAWAPLALAAAIVLLVGGGLIGRFAFPPTTPQVIGPTVDPVIPASYISAATQVHVRCSRGVEHHPHDGWPTSLASIESSFKQYANNGDQHYPDLSNIGFNYLGCGPCGRPDQTGVHLLYRSDTGTDTLSLFVEPFNGQVKIAPGECYYCPLADTHPVLTWRTDRLLFFLVGNARTPVEQARLAMKLPDPL